MHPAALPIRTKHIIPAEQAQALLVRKRARELDYRLIEALRAHAGRRTAVRFAHARRDHAGHWFRCFGNENRAFDAHG